MLIFFNKLGAALDRHVFEVKAVKAVKAVWNVDETGSQHPETTSISSSRTSTSEYDMTISAFERRRRKLSLSLQQNECWSSSHSSTNWELVFVDLLQQTGGCFGQTRVWGQRRLQCRWNGPQHPKQPASVKPQSSSSTKRMLINLQQRGGGRGGLLWANTFLRPKTFGMSMKQRSQHPKPSTERMLLFFNKLGTTWDRLVRVSGERHLQCRWNRGNNSQKQPALVYPQPSNQHNVCWSSTNWGLHWTYVMFEAKDVWNVDQTGVTTVQRPPKMVASRRFPRVTGKGSTRQCQCHALCGSFCTVFLCRML